MTLSKEQKQRIVAQAKIWLDESREAREVVSGKGGAAWDSLESYYVNGSPTPKQTDWWVADVKCNLLASRVERIVGLYVGERPRVSFEPQEPDDALLASDIHDICESDWDNGGYDRELRVVAYDMAIIGTGFWKTWYDEVKKRVCVQRVDPRRMIVDPRSDLAMGRCRFVGECAIKSLGEVLTLYPDAFEDGGDDLTLPIESGAVYRIGDPLPAMPRPRIDAILNMTGGNYADSAADRPLMAGANIEVAELWVRDFAELSWAVGKEAARRITDEMKRSFIITVAGNRVCDVRPSEIKVQGWHPYDIFRAAVRTNSFYGLGDVEGMTKTQDGIDVLTSRTVQFMQLVVNPNFIADSNVQGEVPASWKLAPGGIQFCQGGSNALTPIKMPELPGAVIGVINTLISMLDDRSGVNESVQGRRQAGVESGKHEQVLQEQFARRNKPRLDDRNETLRHWAVRYADLILASYSKAQVQRRLGKDRANDWEKLVSKKQGEFDVRVNVGAAIDADPETAMNFIMQLLQNQLIDPTNPAHRILIFESMRKVWPGIEALIKLEKKQDKASMDAEAQAMQQGQPAPGAPMPQPQPAPGLQPAPVPAGVA